MEEIPMLFVVTAFDRPGALELRTQKRPAHIDYLKGRLAQIRVGGAMLNADEEPIGSMLIIEAADQAAAEAFAADDPFSREGVFERVEIRPWRAALGSGVA
jgi:uncharacterized protein YciI